MWSINQPPILRTRVIAYINARGPLLFLTNSLLHLSYIDGVQYKRSLLFSVQIPYIFPLDLKFSEAWLRYSVQMSHNITECSFIAFNFFDWRYFLKLVIDIIFFHF